MAKPSLWRVVLQLCPQGRATGMVLLDFSVFLGFSHAPLCDGTSGMDVADPFPRCALWLVHRIQQ